MNLKDLLQQVLEIRGVSSAAVVSEEGLVIEGASNDDTDIGFVGSIIASGLASSRVLASLLGEGEMSQAMIEYENGPVLLMPLTNSSQSYIMVTTLDSLASLGRARFKLRKLLPEVAQAVYA
jgi:predicted regulator of Ras-like GTPase activity (Roadblock/LC7/MglB family)